MCAIKVASLCLVKKSKSLQTKSTARMIYNWNANTLSQAFSLNEKDDVISSWVFYITRTLVPRKVKPINNGLNNFKPKILHSINFLIIFFTTICFVHKLTRVVLKYYSIMGTHVVFYFIFK